MQCLTLLFFMICGFFSSVTFAANEADASLVWESSLSVSNGSEANDKGAVGSFDVTWTDISRPKITSKQSEDKNELLSDIIDLDKKEIKNWDLLQTDVTLYGALSRWCQKENWQLLWDADRDFPIDAEITIEGFFSDAVATVLSSLESTDYPMQAVMNPNTKMLTILKRQPHVN
jgi:Toxin co-regulated pilus biosynthesis protein Q